MQAAAPYILCLCMYIAFYIVPMWLAWTRLYIRAIHGRSVHYRLSCAHRFLIGTALLVGMGFLALMGIIHMGAKCWAGGLDAGGLMVAFCISCTIGGIATYTLLRRMTSGASAPPQQPLRQVSEERPRIVARPIPPSDTAVLSTEAAGKLRDVLIWLRKRHPDATIGDALQMAIEIATNYIQER